MNNNQAMMISKVKNIYIMLLHAISKENISIVDHCLDDELTKKYKTIIENNIKNNTKQLFRQLNLTNLNIVYENDEYVTFQGIARYITYYVNRNTNEYVSGDNKNRITKTITLKFRKNNVESKILYKCPNCGVGIEINASGVCSYCDAALDERFSPYILCSIT